MRHNYNYNSVSISKEFNSDQVNGDLDKFENVVEKGVLTTTFDNKIVCKADVSKVYYNFDFTNFSKSLLTEITKYFTPEKYSLRVASGVQEIRLVGDELYIDNEKYKKIISIVNSTDKSKALSMNVGLVKIDERFTRTERFKSYIILTSFCNKHYKSTLPEKIKSFSDNLINFNIDIDFHVKTIEDLKNKEVSIVDFVKSILYKEDGKVIKTVELKLRALGFKLYRDYGFRKNYNTLVNLTDSKINSVTDFTINSKVLYDAYSELFRDSDTSVIGRESRRIIEALENC